jgi:hypothetical protein
VTAIRLQLELNQAFGELYLKGKNRMIITNPASSDYEYEGTYSDPDLTAATIARLDRLQPELALLTEQLELLGLTGAAETIKELRPTVYETWRGAQ